MTNSLKKDIQKLFHTLNLLTVLYGSTQRRTSKTLRKRKKESGNEENEKNKRGKRLTLVLLPQPQIPMLLEEKRKMAIIVLSILAQSPAKTMIRKATIQPNAQNSQKSSGSLGDFNVGDC